MKWNAERITHKKEERIAVCFEKNPELIVRIRQIDGARWSPSKNVPNVPKITQ